jgi:16S rRNA (adenine1518-N6/adenine1519-N6)-dimethyltransferase
VDLYAGKELGQNFLSNPGIARAIVEKTGVSDQTHVLEIGPGLGALTIPLASKAMHVTAVEKDSRLIPLLTQEIESESLKNVDIINKDILKIHISELVKDRKLVVVGNLPYNISSQILFKLIEERRSVEKAFLMFQKELASKIIAPPGGRNNSRLSAVAQYAADIRFVADIGPSAFFPKPDVNSTILEFSFSKPTDFTREQEKTLFNVIKAAFSKRRKSLKNSMTGGEFDYQKEQILKALELAGIDALRRAETLTVEEFKSLARAVWQTVKETEP